MTRRAAAISGHVGDLSFRVLVNRDATEVLRGRTAESGVLDQLVEDARSGHGQVLVVRGDPGVGKSWLLEHLVGRSTGCRVLRATGVESEIELAFGALHQLCVPLLDRVGRLPDPQRDAFLTALGLGTGEPPGRFHIGLAVLTLLADASEEQTLICVIDDAQWLDHASAQTLAFVARRLMHEPIAMVFAAREPSSIQELAGLPELVVGGLSARDARALLESVVVGRLDQRVRDRIVAETRGNPLALLELPRGLTTTELAGGFERPDHRPLTSQIERSFLRQIRLLPADTHRLLVTAAAEPTGDVPLLLRAATLLGIGADAAGPAEDAGLIEIGLTVRFRHPLVRSAAYRGANARDRRRVHQALAEATDPEVDPDRRVWHRAQAAGGPDEDVAVDLVRSASRAQARGGLAATAAFLERATELTPDPNLRGARALAAAEAKHQSGDFAAAVRLLDSAEAGPSDDLLRARGDVLRARISFAISRSSEAPPLFLAAAKRLESLDIELARDTYLDALDAATFVGRLSRGVGLLEVAMAARAAPPPVGPPRPADILLDGLALLITEGYGAGSPVVTRAVRAFSADVGQRRWLPLASHAALDVWDDEAWYVLVNRNLEVVRASGALAELPTALNMRIGAHISACEFAAAVSLLQEGRVVAETTGSHAALYLDLLLAAFLIHEDDYQTLLQATIDDSLQRGEGIGLTIQEWAVASYYNARGRHVEALAAAELAAAHPADLRFHLRALVELIEAAAHLGQRGRAVGAFELLSESTRAAGTDLALGTEARARALISDGAAAEGFYREAIERLGRTRIRMALVDAHRFYGEWLRREGREVEASQQLVVAQDIVSSGGAETRAGIRSEAMGAASPSKLTAQEAHVARLAMEGHTNSEIGSQLFISPRTVEYHLHKVFTKLGVNSRTELGQTPTRTSVG
jgi:DNA-binding CsgD family transcriptional regulator/tetratricopeptide (TPR) repeat protein